jgi:ribosomal protein L16 Arg81 hydroxylase
MHAKVAPQWQTWIVENLMLDVAPGTLVDRLVSEGGVDEASARDAVTAAAAQPAVMVGRSIASRLKKTEALLWIMQELAQSVPRDKVDERRDIDAGAFFADYYSRNRPLVLRETVRHWPALHKWSPRHFAERYGTAPISITANRESDPRYEINRRTHMTQTTMADFVAMLESGGHTNDYYLVANNPVLQTAPLAPLLDDIGGIGGLLEPRMRREHTFLWFGPAGTVTPLHHDKANLCMAQVLGRKRVTLYPTAAIRHMHNIVGVYTEADPENPEHSPIDLRGVPRFEVTLFPGDVLFVPFAWWHHVRALDVSITVSMDNFIFRNDFGLMDPYDYTAAP